VKTYDLAIIGGGLVGSAIAWGAARAGAHVALLDEGDAALRAARGNFGLVWVQGKGAGMPAYAAWTQRSAQLWPELRDALEGETNLRLGLEQPGGFYFCLSEAELEKRASLIQRMSHESGDIGTRVIGRAEARAMVPGLGTEVVGGTYCPMDGHVNPLYLLRALQASLRAARGDYLPNRHVTQIVPQAGGFVLSCGDERLLCQKLVLSAGLGSRDLAPMVGLDMPVQPLRGQILVTERMRPFLHFPTHNVRQTQEGTVLLGDSHEDVGFDTDTAIPVQQQIAARNMRVFPALRDATLIRSWSALRVMSPDGHPIYEQSAAHPGAFAAACHSGVTLAGAHALAYAPSIVAGVLPDQLLPFSSQRFHVQAH
jgi:glycine/D-amino acid oxidase-like deaminating enzyme